GKNATKGYAYGFFQVTGLTLSKTDFDKYSVYRSLDRTTGEPLKDVKVELHFRNASTLVYRTDYNGEFTYNKNSNNLESKGITVSKNGDTLNTNYWQGFYRQVNTKEVESP